MELRPVISINFSAPVWKMEIDESNDIICLETRDLKAKEVAFSTAGLDTGKLYINALQSASGWQCGLSAAAHGVMLIHGFQSEQLPVRKGLTAIDIKTGKTLWANYNLNIERVHPLGLEVYDVRMQPKRINLTSAVTGGAIIPRVTLANNAKENIKYPLQPQAGEFNQLAGLPVHQPENMLFLEYNGYRILSLHALKEATLNQYLYVFDNSGNIVFEDIIAADIQKPQPEAFIVYKNKLIWLQNRSVLKILAL